ncbi:MAG: NADPH:quinone oxidoreductase family protein [Caulobacteraceae bacterium]
MKALVVESLAESYAGCVFKEIATPSPGPGEARVKVLAAAVNFPDLLMTRGAYQHKPPLPFTPGLEFAGVVDQVGEGVGSLGPGDAVVGGAGTGAFAEFALAPARALRRKPERLSFSEAAAFGAVYLTAYVSLVRRARAEAGEWLLVLGAAGGVGLASVDLGKALGLRVIAASHSAEKLAVVAAEYRPDAIVDSSKGFREAVKALTGGQGADIIIDPVGGDVFDEAHRAIAFGGRLLVVGFASGRIGRIDANMPLIKGFSLIGVRAGEFGRRYPDLGAENLAAVWGLAAEGTIRPRVHAEVPLERWRSAFDLLAERKVIGKAVIRPDL